MFIERRKFLLETCKACLFAGAGFLISDLTACSPVFQVIHLPILDNTVRVPLLDFKKSSMQLLRPEGWIYDIAIRKKSTDDYEALLLQCTHQKNQLMAEGNGFICTLHGSRYTLDGQVKKGPAEQTLRKFKTRVESDELVILLGS